MRDKIPNLTSFCSKPQHSSCRDHSAVEKDIDEKPCCHKTSHVSGSGQVLSRCMRNWILKSLQALRWLWKSHNVIGNGAILLAIFHLLLAFFRNHVCILHCFGDITSLGYLTMTTPLWSLTIHHLASNWWPHLCSEYEFTSSKDGMGAKRCHKWNYHNQNYTRSGYP